MGTVTMGTVTTSNSGDVHMKEVNSKRLITGEIVTVDV
jgi:hypothetical protein